MTALAPQSAAAPVPLAVDVDGTLLRTDLLHEAALQFVAQHPLQSWKLAAWLAHGKSGLKARLADVADPGIDTVPLRDEVVAAIHAAQAEGRPVYLASASDHKYVEALATRIGGIAGVFASDGSTNLAGDAKAARLIDAFGHGGYDYIGDAPVDMPVWAGARRVLAVAHTAGFADKIRGVFPTAEIIATPRRSFRPYMKALRPHQWAKNILVFLGLIAGHRFDLPSIAGACLAFVAFSAAASSAYIINDLLDLPGDRVHPRKSRRPFAAGTASITDGIVLAAVLMALAIGLSLLLPGRFVAILGIYVGMTLAYSLALKRRVIVDVIVLGGLYTLRVFAGLAAITSQTSQWLLMFSLFLFLCLAVVKRCTELIHRRNAGKAGAVGRGYRVEDLTVLFPMASAAGYGAVFVFTLYMASPQVATLYAHPNRLWLIAPLLLYWVSRVLVLANRDALHDDPVLFAITDRISWLVAAGVVAVIAVSI